MPVERALQETVARCVATVVYYHNDERATRSTAAMEAEIRTAVGWLNEADLCADAIDEHVIAPVRDELIARYGPEAGGRLNGKFIRAFEATIYPRDGEDRHHRPT